MQNLASGSLPAEVVADIGTRMKDLKEEIAALEATEPPKDFTADMIQSWLEHIKAAPDENAVRLLVERIDVENEKEKTAFNIQSTLKAVLGEHGTLHQKRYFAFLCYRGHFLLHKPGVKMMTRGLFHFSGNLIE